MISRDTIDEVRNRMDIVDVVSDFVTLKRSGQNYKALSPFSNEKTPSFFVVPGKGIFKDFSSGKGGDAISFVMEHEGLSYPEAIRFLAKKYGIEIKEDAKNNSDQETSGLRDSLYLVMAFARDLFVKDLNQSEEGRGIGLSYFRERGFTDRILEKFELGYALDEWNHLEKAALERGFSEEILEKAGLIVKKETSSYDRFRGRVIFPVHNLSGRVIAFGARILSKDKQVNQPKYINSPETDIYHKSDALFGLYFAKNAIRQADNCFLVEGYTDVLAMHQAGIENVVASSGTALTEQQVRLITRFSDNVTVLFDGDSAGIKAALRGIDLLLAGGLNVRVVLLPEGHDPDSYSRSVGNQALVDYLKNAAKDFISFKAGLYASETGSDPIKRAESIREIISSIAKIPDSIKRTIYIQETSALLKVPEGVLITELNKILLRDRKNQAQPQREEVVQDPIVYQEPQPADRTDPVQMVHEQERETLRLLLNYADASVGETHLAEYLFAELDDIRFSNSLYAEIFSEVRERWSHGQVVDSKHFLEHQNQEVRNLVADLVTPRYHTSDHWHEKFQIYFPGEKEVVSNLASGNVIRLKFRLIQSLIQENLSKIKTAEESGNEKILDECLSRHYHLKEAERALAGQLGIVVAG